MRSILSMPDRNPQRENQPGEMNSIMLLLSQSGSASLIRNDCTPPTHPSFLCNGYPGSQIQKAGSQRGEFRATGLIVPSVPLLLLLQLARQRARPQPPRAL